GGAPEPPRFARAAGSGRLGTGGRLARRRALRFWGGAGAGGVLALLPPIYNLVMVGVGTPTLATGRIVPHAPRLAEALAFLIDPNIGLFPSFVVFPAVVLALSVALAVRAPARLLRRDVLTALGCAAVFLGSFAQTTSLNTGATPGMARYWVWLLPPPTPPLRSSS